MSECRWRGGGAALTSLSNLRVAVVEEFDELCIEISHAIQKLLSAVSYLFQFGRHCESCVNGDRMRSDNFSSTAEFIYR